MPTVMLRLGDTGKLEGVNERHERGYQKWRKTINELTVGDTVCFSFKVPRSGPYHRRFFAIVNRLFDMQEQFVDEKVFLDWLKVGAGHCEFLPGPSGKPMAIPKSIKFEELDQADFEPIAEDIWDFMRSAHCSRFLWPHANVDDSRLAIQEMLDEFS